MANANDTSTSNGPAEAASRNDLIDRVHEKLSQAEALSHIVYGEGGEGFRCYNEDIQDRVLWLLSQTVAEAHKAFANLAEVLSAERARS